MWPQSHLSVSHWGKLCVATADLKAMICRNSQLAQEPADADKCACLFLINEQKYSQ